MSDGLFCRPFSRSDFFYMNLKILAILAAGHFVTDINTGALPAFLPFLKESLGLSYTMTASILLAFNITSSVIQPIFGFFSDRWSVKWLLPVRPSHRLLGPGASRVQPFVLLGPPVCLPERAGPGELPPGGVQNGESAERGEKSHGHFLISSRRQPGICRGTDSGDDLFRLFRTAGIDLVCRPRDPHDGRLSDHSPLEGVRGLFPFEDQGPAAISLFRRTIFPAWFS